MSGVINVATADVERYMNLAGLSPDSLKVYMRKADIRTESDAERVMRLKESRKKK